MDMRFSEEQRIMLDTVHTWLERSYPRQKITALEREHRWPQEFTYELAELGLYSVPFPEEIGGIGLGLLDAAYIAEELGRHSLDFADFYAEQVSFGLGLFDALGPERALSHWEPISAGERVVFSDRLSTTASSGNPAFTLTQHADGYHLTGMAKAVFGLVLEGAHIALIASYGDEWCCVLSPVHARNVEVTRLETLGRNMLGLYDVTFEDTIVPKEHIVPISPHFSTVATAASTILRAAGCVGAAQAVVDEATAYARVREQFGRPIGNFQALAHMLADAQTDVDVARLLTYDVASKVDTHEEASPPPEFGWLVTETLNEVVTCGMEVMGGYGYSKEYDMQRYLRDACVMPALISS